MVDREEAPCDVWLVDVATVAHVHHWLLDDDERHRADRFRAADDRRRFVLGVALLKVLVARDAGLSPPSIKIDRRCLICGGPHGRPRIPASDLQVSVSHSGSLVGVAVTRAGRVGMDIQARCGRAAPPIRGMLARQELVTGPDDLFTYWCRKESVVKATGDGMAVPFDEVVVTAALAAPSLVSYRGKRLVGYMADLDVGAGYSSAVTVLTDTQVSVAVHRAEALLATE